MHFLDFYIIYTGKPKIFMLLSCRGNEPQVKQTYVHPNRTDEADSVDIVRMPTDADIITIYATTPGNYQYFYLIYIL